MHVKESNQSLSSFCIPLTMCKEPPHSDYLRNQSLIDLLLFIVPVGVPLVIIGLLFIVLDEHSVHISPKKGTSIVSIDHSVRIDHGDDLENETRTELPRDGIFRDQSLKDAMDYPTRVCFTRVNSSLNYNDFSML
jgi:hypothetical protein